MKILKKNSAYIIEIEQSEKETGRTMYNTRHELAKLITHKENLQSNWNSLREFINDWIEDLENQRESIEGTDLFENHTLVILDDIKIRMNELEGVDNG